MHVRRTRSWSRYWHELRRYPSAVVGLLIREFVSWEVSTDACPPDQVLA